MKGLFATVAIALISIFAVQAQDIHVRLSPNPASTKVQVNLDHEVTGQVTVEIFSVIGTRVGEVSVFQANRENSFLVNTSQIAEGIYLVRVSYGKSSDVRQIKIQP